MNSANVVLNLAGPVAAPAAEAEAGTDGGAFSLALASVQPPGGGCAAVIVEDAAADITTAEVVSDAGALALIASMLNVAPMADDLEGGPAKSAPPAGAAVSAAEVLAGMRAGQPQPAQQAETSEPDPAGVPAQVAQPVSARVATRDGVEQRVADATKTSRQPEADAEAAPERDPLSLLDKLQSVAAAAASTGQGSSTSGGTAQQAAALHLAASGSREASSAGTTDAPAAGSGLREPVGSARWADELGSRMVLMSVRGQQHGSLVLTPEHLGPLEVQISVNKDTANVWFGAQHADTRAALTEAMPRLRELLAASGLSLGQAGVSEHAPRGTQNEPEGARLRANSGVEPAAGGEAPTAAWRPWRPGLIDTYA